MMDTFLRIDINIAAFIMLGVVCYVAFKSLDRQDPMNRMFLYTSVAVLFELFLKRQLALLMDALSFG